MERIKSIIIFITSSLIFINQISTINGQVFAFGDCPTLNGKDNFNVEKFEGPWYVVEKFGAVSKCVRENVTRAEGNNYMINAEMESLGVPLFQSANVKFFNGLPKSIMRINFPAKYELEPANYWVLDTDYESWAVVWSCDEGDVIGHRESAQIMSRLPTLDTPTRNKLKGAMGRLGISVSNFIPVSQQDCPWDLKGNTKKTIVRQRRRILN